MNWGEAGYSLKTRASIRVEWALFHPTMVLISSKAPGDDPHSPQTKSTRFSLLVTDLFSIYNASEPVGRNRCCLRIISAQVA